MYRLSEIVSKPVISLQEASGEGTVKNVFFDSKLNRATILQLFCEDDSQPETKYLSCKNILAVGAGAVCIKSSNVLCHEWDKPESLQSSPINLRVFDVHGQYLGLVCDIVFGQGFVVDSICTSSKSFSSKQIASFSPQMIVLQDEKNPVKLGKAVQKIAQADTRKTVILNMRAKNEQEAAKQDSQASVGKASASNAKANVENGVQGNSQTDSQASVQDVLRTDSHSAKPAQTQKSAPAQHAGTQNKESFSALQAKSTVSAAQHSQWSLRQADIPTAYAHQANGQVVPESYIYYRALIDNSVVVPERVRQENVEVSRSPQKESNTGYGFLLGKVLSYDLVDGNGEKIAKQGDVITQEIIEQAKQSGKIVQLALQSE